MADFPTPQSRNEAILQNMLGANNHLAPPMSREEDLLQQILEQGGGGGGTTDYSALSNKPSINNVTLSGNKSLADLGISNELPVPSSFNVGKVAAVVRSGPGENDYEWSAINIPSNSKQINVITQEGTDALLIPTPITYQDLRGYINKGDPVYINLMEYDDTSHGAAYKLFSFSGRKYVSSSRIEYYFTNYVYDDINNILKTDTVVLYCADNYSASVSGIRYYEEMSGGSSEIDDTTTTTSNTWSADKINSEITNHLIADISNVTFGGE